MVKTNIIAPVAPMGFDADTEYAGSFEPADVIETEYLADENVAQATGVLDTESPEVEEAAATPKKEKKPKTPKAPKEPKEPKPKKEKKGLRDPQLRILKALVTAGEPLTRKQLSKLAPVDLAACTEYVGSANETVRLANDEKFFPSLLSLGYVVQVEVPSEDGSDKKTTAYEITETGIAQTA